MATYVVLIDWTQQGVSTFKDSAALLILSSQGNLRTTTLRAFNAALAGSPMG